MPGLQPGTQARRPRGGSGPIPDHLKGGGEARPVRAGVVQPLAALTSLPFRAPEIVDRANKMIVPDTS